MLADVEKVAGSGVEQRELRFISARIDGEGNALLFESDCVGQHLESGGRNPIAEQLQSIRRCFAVVIANSPRDIISDVNLDVRIAIDSGAKAGLRSAVNLGEHDGTYLNVTITQLMKGAVAYLRIVG
jgi:hypothetical protein